MLDYSNRLRRYYSNTENRSKYTYHTPINHKYIRRGLQIVHNHKIPASISKPTRKMNEFGGSAEHSTRFVTKMKFPKTNGQPRRDE